VLGSLLMLVAGSGAVGVIRLAEDLSCASEGGLLLCCVFYLARRTLSE